jgi:hypothetical protein
MLTDVNEFVAPSLIALCSIFNEIEINLSTNLYNRLYYLNSFFF